VAVLGGFVHALACGGDESRLSPSAYDSPPERVIESSLPSDDSTGTNSGVPAVIGGSGGKPGGAGPSDPLSGLDGGNDDTWDSAPNDAAPDAIVAELTCPNGSFRCPGSQTSQCFLPRDGFGLPFDCRSEAACAEAISQCEPAEGGCPAEQCCRLAAQIPEGPGVFSVSTGNRYTCAVVTGGAIRCWGGNLQGQLGYGHLQTIGDDEFPYLSGDVELGEPAVQVVTGAGHTCALLATGAVRCWGDAGAGKLGFGDYQRAKWIAEELEGRTVDVGDDETARHAPRVELGAPALQLAAGGTFTCALLATGAVRCWGDNGDGRLGVPESIHTGDIGDKVLPACAPPVDLGGPATFIASGQLHTCAILRGGNVRCFGEGSYGRLGYGNTADVGKDDVPAAAGDVELNGAAVSLSAGPRHTCAVLDSGLLRCWGEGNSLKLGFDESFNLGDVRTPELEPPLDLGRRVQQVAAGNSHTCALLDNGLVRCWGSHVVGQVGAPVSNSSPLPLSRAAAGIQLGGLATQIDARSDHTCAVLENRELVCWGDNSAGALGYGNTAQVPETLVPAANGFVPVLSAPPTIPDPNATIPDASAPPASLSEPAAQAGPVRLF
jgi:alpha-tubulin suppressor-like RCC1 family protein